MFFWFGLVNLLDIMVLWILYVYVYIFLWISCWYNILCESYMYICSSQIWISKFDFFAGKDAVGAVLYLTAPTNRNYSVMSRPYSFIGAAHNTRGGCDTSRPYKSICRGGLGTTPKSMICRHGCLWAAGKTAPTNPNKSPLQMFTVVVQAKPWPYVE
jgi:hypothetical protein